MAVGIVRYHTGTGQGPDSCPIGVLLYAKATIGRDAPVSVQSFGLRDKIFPRYPTYDQFLGEDEFDNLVALGDWAASRASSLHGKLEGALSQNVVPTVERDAIGGAFQEIYDWQNRTNACWVSP